MQYKRSIPETKTKSFMAFVANSLSLSGVPVNHVQVRQESNKEGRRHPWIQGQMDGCNELWRWIMKRDLIQHDAFLKWFVELNNILMSGPCNNEKNDMFRKAELRKLRNTDPGGGEVSNVDHGLVIQNMESLFSVFEKCDQENDEFIMPNRIRFNIASDLARIAWKAQFQVGYICPFFQGNWVSARLLTNTLRCHWSLPWHTFEYERNENQELGLEYHAEIQRWKDLFDAEGVLTESCLDY